MAFLVPAGKSHPVAFVIRFIETLPISLHVSGFVCGTDKRPPHAVRPSPHGMRGALSRLSPSSQAGGIAADRPAAAHLSPPAARRNGRPFPQRFHPAKRFRLPKRSYPARRFRQSRSSHNPRLLPRLSSFHDSSSRRFLNTVYADKKTVVLRRSA
jgi:hypothetical protein